ALGRLAILVAETDSAASIARGPAAPIVEIAFSELERRLVRFERAPLQPAAPDSIADIDGLHDVVRGLTSASDIEAHAEWRARLAGYRRDFAAAITSEIEGISGPVRRAVRIWRTGDGHPRDLTDAVEGASRGLRLFRAAERAQ